MKDKEEKSKEQYIKDPNKMSKYGAVNCYEFMSNISNEYMSLINSDYRYVVVNNAYCRAMGKTREELIGQTVEEVWGKKQFEKAILNYLDRGFSGETVNYRAWFKFSKDTKLFYDVNCYPYYEDNKVTHLVILTKDITEPYLKGQKVIQQARLASLGQFASGIIHDLKNIINAGKGLAELALRKLSDDSQSKDIMRAIIRNNDRGENLLSQLLLFSSKKMGEEEIVSVNTLIKSLMEMMLRLMHKNIEIVTELDEGLWNIKCDKGNIEQVIMNLFINAKDAMPAGGKIIIKTENTELKEEDTHGNSPGKYVRISVQDTGTGMDEETLHNIFDPFFSTKAPGKGTGLGLAIVYGIIEKHGGWTDVRSCLGSGTTFIICFKAYFEENGI